MIAGHTLLTFTMYIDRKTRFVDYLGHHIVIKPKRKPGTIKPGT